jgi:hypothetical protein
MGPDSWTRCRPTREIPFGFALGRLCLRLKSGSDQDGAHRALYGYRIRCPLQQAAAAITIAPLSTSSPEKP